MHRLRERRGGDDVADAQATAGGEHPEGLTEHALLVRGQVDDAVAEDDVDAGVGHGEMLDLAETDGDVVGTDLAHVLSRPLDHGGGHVDADHLAFRADALGREQAVDAAPAA